MSDLAIVSIVEGHGDQRAVPILLRRLLTELLSCGRIAVLPPIRVPRSKMIKPPELLRAVALADLKLRQDPVVAHRLVLVIFDADDDPACALGPKLLGMLKTERPDLDIAVVLAVAEFETWFIAAAESLVEYLDVAAEEVPVDTDRSGLKKGWLQRHFRGQYTETIEQPALTAKMNLTLARRRSPSFDKLCRELERRCGDDADETLRM